jgi:hypothetical protein
MITYTLSEYYRFFDGESHYIEFDIELDSDEDQRLRDFLARNGKCDYSYVEWEHGDLFEIINSAANEAVLADINSRRETPLEFDEVDWTWIRYDFYWDDRLF